MAKSGVFERDPTDNLKKELQKLVKTIVEDSSDDEILDQTLQILQSLKQGIQYYPQEFNCPLSKQIMTDPVIICTGKTYDRVSIQKWLSGGNRTCPETGQVLSHTVLTPNHLVRDMIAQWCKNHGVRAQNSPGSNPINPVQYLDEQGLTEANRKHFRSLLKKLSLSDSISEKKEAARMLRSLTKKNPAFRGFFGECSTAIPELISPLSEVKNGVDPNLCEDVITTLLNVSIHESNKKLVVETVNVVPVLLDALRLGTIETRTNAAATLFTLSALDSNKLVIAKAGGLRPLIELLEEGHALAMKDAASAIFNLCIVH
ncbi:putative U box domain, armadillo-like helical, Zinc finger, RING/FYVE/PHD-type [Helianthus debilis subsp. tardiflorus]